MPYHVAFDETDRIVEVRVWGPAGHDEHLSALKEAAALCTEHKSRGVLVDLRDLNTKGVSTTIDCFEFGRSLAEDPLPPRVPIAHTMPAEAGSRTDVQFVITVASNRGRWVGTFATMEEARQWLLARPSAQPDPPTTG